MAIPNSVSISPNPMLTPIAVDYRNNDFIFRNIAPLVPGDLEVDKYLEFGEENFKSTEVIATGSSRVSNLDWSSSPKEYRVYHYGKESVLDYVLENGLRQASFSGQKFLTNRLMGQLDLDSEIRTAIIMQTAGNYAVGNSFAAAGDWSLDATDPQKDIDKAVSLLIGRGEGDLVGWMSEDVWLAYKNNAKIVDRVKHVMNMAGQSVVDPYAQAAGCKMFAIGKAWKKNVATGALERVWGKFFGVTVVPRGGPSRESIQFAATFTQRFFGQETNVYTKDDLDYGVHSGMKIRVARSEAIKVVANKAGALITAPIP